MGDMDERARRAARRNLTFGETKSLPMTPARPVPEDLYTPAKFAEAGLSQ
jgi:hypothetical protein